jgi:hypothetical protein
VPRNIASITLFAAAAAATTGALPRTALALCSGNACSAVTATATYDASNKKIIYILKNKDQATLHIRYSVNADGHSVNVSSMDTDIGPLETVTRNLPFNDAALKKNVLSATTKYEVDIRNADFKGSQAASSPGGTKTVDALFGKLTYFAAQESKYGRMVTSCAGDFKKTAELYDQLVAQHSQMIKDAATVPSLKEVEAEIRKLMEAKTMESMNVRNSAGVASNSDGNLQVILVQNRMIKKMVADAKTSFDRAAAKVSADEKLKRASDLITMINEQYETITKLISYINFAVDAAEKMGTGDLNATSAAKNSFETGRFFAAQPDMIASIAQPYVLSQAQNLIADANDILDKGIKSSFEESAKNLKTAQELAIGLKPTVDAFKANYEKRLRQAQRDFTTVNTNGHNKGHFSFDNIRKALDEARASRNLAVQTAQTAKQAIAWTNGLKDKTEWMADPSGDAKTLENILTNANSMGAKAIEWGRDSEATLARLEDTYAKAMELSGMTISQ